MIKRAEESDFAVRHYKASLRVAQTHSCVCDRGAGYLLLLGSIEDDHVVVATGLKLPEAVFDL